MPSLIRLASIVGAVLVIGLGVSCSHEPANIFEAVAHNERAYVEQWLNAGGNPNATTSQNESLLYIATGPHGGIEVLELLLKAGANPNIGMPDYTPLMNAAGWVSLEAVELLLTYGANPHQRNAQGQTALDVVGLSGGREQAVIARLKRAMSDQKPPNTALLTDAYSSRLRAPSGAAKRER